MPPHDPRTDALLDPAVYADGDRLEAVFADLRATPGLAWNATAGFWAVARHADVHAASSDPATFCSSRGILVEEIGRTYDSPPTMMHTDPPAHTRYRSLVQPGFKPSVVRSLEPSIRAVADELLDGVAVGEPVDIVSAFAVPFPLRVIAGLLGVPDDDLDRLWRWSEAAIPGATDWSEDERMTLLGEMTVELLGLGGGSPSRAARPPRTGRRGVDAGRRRGRRRAPVGRRARHVPHPVAGRRQRDDPARHLRNGVRPRAAPGPVGGAASRPRVGADGGRGGAAMDDAGRVLHAHGDARRAPWAAPTSRPAIPCCSSTRPPTATRPSSGRPPIASTSPGRRTTTSPSASARTSASALRWPAPSWRSSSARCSTASAGSSRPVPSSDPARRSSPASGGRRSSSGAEREPDEPGRPGSD